MELAIKFTEWVLLIIIITTSIISWKHRHNKLLFPILLYILISLALNLFLKIYDFLPKNNTNHDYTLIAINIYSLLEISLLFYFINSITKGAKFRSVMKILYFLFLLIFGIILYENHKGFIFYIPYLLGLENLFIIISCFFYMYETFNSDILIDFKSDSKFIVISGILFYFSISIPYFFGAYNIFKIGLFHVFNLLNLFFYVLLFISFMKAYLCPIQELKQ
jgi:hypothetical protein